MKRFGKFLAIVSVGVMTATVPMSNASAQGDYPSAYGWSPQDSIMGGDPSNQRPRWQHRGNGKHFRNGGRNYNGHVRRNRGPSNDGLALGLGIAAGALALGVIANSQRTYRVEPQPYATRSSGMAPWSPGWYRYCDQKYRSFNASTGTFRGYDGRDHFCVAN